MLGCLPGGDCQVIEGPVVDDDNVEVLVGDRHLLNLAHVQPRGPLQPSPGPHDPNELPARFSYNVRIIPLNSLKDISRFIKLTR